MGCYCGCDTQANRVKWAVAAVLFTLAWVCATVTSAIESSCYQEHPDAMGTLHAPPKPSSFSAMRSEGIPGSVACCEAIGLELGSVA